MAKLTFLEFDPQKSHIIKLKFDLFSQSNAAFVNTLVRTLHGNPFDLKRGIFQLTMGKITQEICRILIITQKLF